MPRRKRPRTLPAFSSRVALLSTACLMTMSALVTPWSPAIAATDIATAAAPTLSPGEYVTEGGWGRLRLTARSSGALAFDLQANGPNGHSCALEGDIRGGQAVLQGYEPGTSCRVGFKVEARGIEVSIADGGSPTCRQFCGARAGFEGLYRVTPAACTPTAIQAHVPSSSGTTIARPSRLRVPRLRRFLPAARPPWTGWRPAGSATIWR